MKSSDGCWRNVAVLSVVLIGLTLAGCSQHEGVPTSEETASADQHLPFDGASDKGGIFPTGSLTPTAIPAGTPLAVRMRTSLSSATSRPGDSFEAVLDEPIVVRGKMVAPRGASVTGKVLDAKAAGDLQERGYMRLALTAVSLNGQSIPIQTSSIFVKRSHREPASSAPAGTSSTGSPIRVSTDRASTDRVSIGRASIGRASTGGASGNGKGTLIGASTRASAPLGADGTAENNDVGISAERRLTFRLAQPLPLGT